MSLLASPVPQSLTPTKMDRQLVTAVLTNMDPWHAHQVLLVKFKLALGPNLKAPWSNVCHVERNACQGHQGNSSLAS